MAIILANKRWGWRKPTPGAQIAWGHPLAAGLVSACLFSEGGGQTFYDDALGNPVNMQGNLWIPGQGMPLGPSAGLQAGTIVNGGGTNTGISLGQPQEVINTSKAITILCCINMSVTDATRGGSNNPVLMAWDFSTGNRPWTLDMNGSPAFFRWFIQGGNCISSTHSYGGGVPTIVAATYNSVTGALALYRDGVQIQTASGSGTIVQNLSANVTLGYRVYTTGGNFTGAWGGSFGFAYIWNRELKPADIQALQVEPFAFYQAQSPQRRYWLMSFSDTGAADIELVASATVMAVPTSAASLTLTAACTSSPLETGTGAVVLAASATESADPTAAGSVALTASGTESASPTATGDIELVASATDKVIATVTGDVELVGGTSPQAIVTASGSLTLTAGATASAQPTATGDVELTAGGSPSAGNTATGAIVLNGTAAATLVTAAGTITLVGAGVPLASPLATADIELDAFAHVEPPPPGTERVILWALSPTRQRVWRFGEAGTLWVFGTAIARSSLAPADQALLVP